MTDVEKETVTWQSGSITRTDSYGLYITSGAGIAAQESQLSFPCYIIVAYHGAVEPEMSIEGASTSLDYANRLFDETQSHVVGGSVELQQWEGHNRKTLRKKKTIEKEEAING